MPCIKINSNKKWCYTLISRADIFISNDYALLLCKSSHYCNQKAALRAHGGREQSTPKATESHISLRMCVCLVCVYFPLGFSIS